MDRLTSFAVFVSVVENGGFSAAARRLRMSVATVSNHIQSLEERLGARLLNRTTRKLAVTAIGKQYYERCIQIIATVKEADELVTALHAMPRGKLRLHIEPGIVPLVTPAVEAFLSTYRQAKIDLIASETVDLVDDGFDLAIRSTPATESRFIVRNLRPWRPILCCAPSYLDDDVMPQNLQDITRYNCLRYSFYPFGSEWRFLDPRNDVVSVNVTGNLVTNSVETLRLLALSGQGLVLAPDFIVEDDIQSGNLIRLLPDYKPIEFSLYVIYPHRLNVSALVRQLIDLLVAHVSHPGQLVELVVAC